MVRILATFLIVLALSVALIGIGTPREAAAAGAATDPLVAPADTTPRSDVPVVRIPRTLRGLVVTWRDGRLERVPFAHVGTGEHTLQADGAGRFTIPAAIRTNHVNIVAPGYHVIRRVTTSDYVVAFAKPLDVRAIYLPFDRLDDRAVLDWALRLARDGVITSLVIDVKNEGGAVLPEVANQTAIEMGAVRGTGTDIEGFLEDLEELGVYRIARVVTFMDGWLARGHPQTAIRDFDGTIFYDDINFAWVSPFVGLSRRHNVEIGINAAAYFDEVQYDYVRLPVDSIPLRSRISAAQRSAIIAQFASEAAHALHAVGAALSFDTFGLTTMATNDSGIGQVLEELAPFLDYYSPMVYPSTWSTGWFGLEYPAADPYTVVLGSVGSAVSRLEGYNIVVRPWLQDFPDYNGRGIRYGPEHVSVQIAATIDAGGSGFMLWDPRLTYQLGPLGEIANAGLD
jgi:hypothetical protein